MGTGKEKKLAGLAGLVLLGNVLGFSRRAQRVQKKGRVKDRTVRKEWINEMEKRWRLPRNECYPPRLLRQQLSKQETAERKSRGKGTHDKTAQGEREY
jgi:hypothetical protein